MQFFLRLAFAVPFLLFVAGAVVSVVVWVTQGAESGVFVPSRNGSGEIEAWLAAILYSVLAGVSAFGGWFVPRSIARRRSTVSDGPQ